MILRKINAGISLMTTLVLLGHAMPLSVWMLYRCSFEKVECPMSVLLVPLMVAHAVISIVLAVLGHKGAEKRKCNSYPKLNRSTILQRASGIFMLVLLGLHIAGAQNYYRPKMLHAVVHPLFFAVVLAHMAVSFSKGLITLGIGSAKGIKAVDITVKVLCLATLIAGVTGFYMCLFMGVAK